MSSGSFKELTKVINAYIPTISLPLPDDLILIIQAYLDKHSPVEESDSQRLQDELVNIYQKEVKNKTERYPIFVAILRQLKPAIAGSARLLQWWETLILPVLSHLSEEKGLAVEARGMLLEILAYDTDDGDNSDAANTSSVLSEKLLEIWLKTSSLAPSEVDPAAHFLEEQIRLVLLDFGKKRPKDFLTTIDKFFVKKDCRAQVLPLLCEFIRYGPPHLHQLLETPLFGNLLRCLQIDTSTTVVSLTMTALTMFLPHIPNDIATHLPSLFNIYCRILFWDRERLLSPDSGSDNMDPEKHSARDNEEKDAPNWEKLSYSFESDDETVPELLYYFTFLYGLYPINFMSYIRKPERYLRHAKFQGVDDIEVQPSEIRQRSEPFRQVHLLHPNFYSMTIESELTDLNRWMKCEAADVVAACMALCGPLYPGTNILPAPQLSAGLLNMPENRDPDGDVPDQPLLSQGDEQIAGTGRVSSGAFNSSWRNTTSTIVDSPDGSRRPSSRERTVFHTSQPLADSPTLGPLDMRTNSPTLPPRLLLTDSQEKLEQAQMVRRSLHQSLANESEISFASSQQREPSIADSYLQSLEQRHFPHSPSLQPSPTEGNANIASLHREIMLLKNELNFERYLKQQHLSHIGQLRRKHVREATVEAETQNLFNSNKRLRNKLEDAQNTAVQMKKESEKSRTHSKKWEAELTAKLRALREEQKKWNIEMETMRRELASSHESNSQLKLLVVQSETEVLASRQKVQSIETNVDEIGRLYAELEKLTATLRTYEAREIENERAKASESLALAKVEVLEMKLAAQNNEVEVARLSTEDQLADLRAELEETKLRLQSQQPNGFQSMLDKALAISHSRLAESQKAHAHLLRKYTSLQGQYLALKDLQDSDEPLLSGAGAYSRFETEQAYRMGSQPPDRRNRRRGLSDPDVVDRSGIGASSPPEFSTSYVPIRPGKVDTTAHTPRPSSQNEVHSSSQRAKSSDIFQHVRSGSADSAQAGSALGLETGSKAKIKPGSDIRVYGRGGVQNVGTIPKEKKKDKKKDEQDKKDKKGAGLRGIRGFNS